MLESQVQDKETENILLNLEIRSLKAQIQSDNQNVLNIMQSKQEQINEMNKRFLEMEQRQNKDRSTIVSYENTISTQKSTIFALKDEITKLNNHVSSLEPKVRYYEKELAKYTKK